MRGALACACALAAGSSFACGSDISIADVYAPSDASSPEGAVPGADAPSRDGDRELDAPSVGRGEGAVPARDGQPPSDAIDSADVVFEASSDACAAELCGDRATECGNCIDDDADGRTDSEDPECTGACDDAEASFGTEKTAGTIDCARDCYFDEGPGLGDDGCLWSRECDPLATLPNPLGQSCTYDPSAKFRESGKDKSCDDLAEEPTEKCLSTCLPLVPAGCDCFGCCELPGAKAPVFLGTRDAEGNPTCDLAHAADPARCEPCTIVQSCWKACGACEPCIGRPAIDAGCP